MWKLCHRLFGSHYVALQFSFDTYIRRVRFTPIGEPYIKFNDRLIFLADRMSVGEWRALTFQKEPWLAEITKKPVEVRAA